MKHAHTLSIALTLAVAAVSLSRAADGDETLDALIRAYLAGRGADVQLAPPAQLARRYAIDLTGVIPTEVDLDATAGMSPDAMFDYFASASPMPHTSGERPYVWFNLLEDADHFLFSNSTQFSQVAHITEFRDQLRRVYAEGWSYRELARWALTSQMFLNRFPSAADRANAAFFLFLGRDSFSSEVPVGNAWNVYELRDPSIPASQAETDPDYHVYDDAPERCQRAGVVCTARLWDREVSTPDEAIDALLDSPMFAEATVDRYWQRLIGAPLPGVDFPEVRRALVRGFVESDYSVNWLIRELATSAAYTQEMMFR